MTKVCYLCEAVKQCEQVGIEKTWLCHLCTAKALTQVEEWKDFELLEDLKLLKSYRK